MQQVQVDMHLPARRQPEMDYCRWEKHTALHWRQTQPDLCILVSCRSRWPQRPRHQPVLDLPSSGRVQEDQAAYRHVLADHGSGTPAGLRKPGSTIPHGVSSRARADIPRGQSPTSLQCAGNRAYDLRGTDGYTGSVQHLACSRWLSANPEWQTPVSSGSLLASGRHNKHRTHTHEGTLC